MITHLASIHKYKVVMSGPGVCVCNSSHDAIIWRAESRTHLSKQTRPSTKHSWKASNVRGIPSSLDGQLGSSSSAHKCKCLWVGKSHTHRQVASTILSIES